MLSWKILLILIFCLIDYGKTVVINCIAYTAEANSLAFDAYIDGFNQYAKDNNLDIKVELNLMTMNSNYDSLGNSYLMIESLLKKGSSKYDIYFYDVSYLKQYSPYLIDLKEVLPEEHIYMYDEQILDQICTYDGKILGLPFSIWIDALYSNINLLNEYNKRVPKTWDELLETGKEILEKEKTLKNNTELVGYNGLMFDADNGLCSIYEFIYSCRETYESPFPELTSENTIKATKLIKKIKDELSSDEIFRTNTVFDVNLFEKNALFMKFWVFFGVLHNDNYVLSILPGMKEGISGSALIGYNIGISKNIQKDKKDAAIKAVEFMTSKGFQKKLVLQEIIISGILSLYDDEEVCSSIKNCEVYKDVQLIAKPVNKTDNYIEYSEKFTNYFYGYLYGNSTETEESVLKKIDDLTKIYHIAMDSKETSSGLTFFILFLVTIIMMIFSLIFLFIKKFEKYFSFLSKLDWIIIVIGIIIIAVSNFYNFGELTDFKCQMKNSLLALGFTFIYGPILCQLIINFPETNKYSFWVNDHKLILILTFILIDILLNGLSLLKPYGIKDIIVNEGQNFRICKGGDLYVIIMNILIIVYKCIMILALFLLLFIEWNNEATFFETRFILSTIYINIITFTLLFILEFLITNNYIIYFIFQECIIYTISFINYIILYGIKLIFPQLYKKDEMNEIIKKVRVNESFLRKTDTSCGSTTADTVKTRVSGISSRSNASNKNSIYSKILDYHYTTSVS